MTLIDATPAASVADRFWQIVYRAGFPVARAVWGLLRARHVGALVACRVGPAVLLVRSSYRAEWSFPGGGVKRGETPCASARRELREEIGVEAGGLGPAVVVSGHWEGRRDTVHVFALELAGMPVVRLDNREIVAARLVGWDEVGGLRLTGAVRAYLAAVGR